MYALLYNRLTGWLWFAIGLWSLFSPNIGDYIHVARPEIFISFGLGILGMLGARSRRVNQLVTCGFLTITNLALLLLAGAAFASHVFSPTPFEGVLRLLCTGWGIFCLYSEFRIWLSHARQQPT